jgi:sulfide:quinone oxidoreductase
VEWVKDMVAGFDPAANTVVTAGGQRIRYDFLVVATGVHLDYAQIEGMDVGAIGSNGLASVYPGPQAAQATWAAMQAFHRQGRQRRDDAAGHAAEMRGRAAEDELHAARPAAQAGTLGASKVSFHVGAGQCLRRQGGQRQRAERWKDAGHRCRVLAQAGAIDIGARRATFVTPEGEKQKMPYDFLHVVPPMRAPDAVKNSDLAWKEGPFAAGGWLEVDKATLQHRRFPNVFGIGDINGTPRGKTAATVKKSAPLVAHNLVEVIAGRKADETFDGYTSCPLITREGSAMLIEFDYEGRLTPSLPMIEPLQDSFFAWLMKYRMLKPAYMAVLKGRV